MLAGAGAIAAAGATSALAQPGGGGGQPPRCTIDFPADGFTINDGESVTYAATITRDTPPYTVVWDYPGGDDLNADGDGNTDQYIQVGVTANQQVTTPPVFYNTGGTNQGFTATVTATGGAGKTCSQTVSINVVGQDGPPTAVDDAYDTIEDDPLNVAAPGVLQNDQDENPQTLTAELVADVNNGTLTLNPDGSFTYTYGGAGPYPATDFFTYNARDAGGQVSAVPATVTITINERAGITARGDAYATPIGKTLNVTATRVSGVLYNDFGGIEPYTAINLDTTGTTGTVTLNADGSFDYTPSAIAIDNAVDTFTYQAQDSVGNLSNVATVAVQILADQPDYKMTMNYELGMHCTGFEFAYCCVLPPYNSIVAQITKPQVLPDAG
ncbi:MAG: cadherin-like domain-containing protein [Gammaproteobacteria bacterium]|nr:cadherin-like domain-containing protein [Gammaproteobacteria bacterium]